MSLMRRLDPDVVAGSLMTLLCVVTSVPVAALQVTGQDPTAGPWWLWWLAFAGFLVAFVTVSCGMESLPASGRRAMLAAQVVLGAVVVLLGAGLGFTPILLVFTSALSAYVVSRRSTVTIVAINTIVVGVATGVAGGDRFAVGMTTALYLLIQAVSVLAVVGEQRQQHARRELSRAHTELRATTALLADSSRQTERLRIARDLHDIVGHQLSALALELEVASHRAVGPESEHVTRSRQIAKDLLRDVRATVSELRATAPELRATLETVVADLPRPQVHLDVADELALDDERATTLVRVAQEVVTNAIRHADARNLWLAIAAAPDGGVVLTARDDGGGARAFEPGNGLRGLRERVEQLGGTATFRPAPSFEVVARVPAP